MLKLTGPGAVTEQQFKAEFDAAVENSKKLDIQELPAKLKQVVEIFDKSDLDWNIYMTAIKNFRPLIAVDTNKFQTLAIIEKLSEKLIEFATDLRSITCKESCVTIAMISEVYGDAVEKLCIDTLRRIIPLYQNSAKIIASSAYACSLIMLKSIRSTKMLQSLIAGYESKSTGIRGVVLTILRQVLEEWTPNEAEESMNCISALLLRSFYDSDQTVRTESRKIFNLIDSGHSQFANDLVRQLDPKTLKLIGKSNSLASSTQSINELVMSRRSIVPPMAARAATYDALNVSVIKSAQKKVASRQVKGKFVFARPITNSKPSCIPKQPRLMNKENYNPNATMDMSMQKKPANKRRSSIFSDGLNCTNTSLLSNTSILSTKYINEPVIIESPEFRCQDVKIEPIEQSVHSNKAENEDSNSLVDLKNDDTLLEFNVQDHSMKADNVDISAFCIMLPKIRLEDDPSLLDLDGDTTMMNHLNMLDYHTPPKKETQLSPKVVNHHELLNYQNHQPLLKQESDSTILLQQNTKQYIIDDNQESTIVDKVEDIDEKSMFPFLDEQVAKQFEETIRLLSNSSLGNEVELEPLKELYPLLVCTKNTLKEWQRVEPRLLQVLRGILLKPTGAREDLQFKTVHYVLWILKFLSNFSPLCRNVQDLLLDVAAESDRNFSPLLISKMDELLHMFNNFSSISTLIDRGLLTLTTNDAIKLLIVSRFLRLSLESNVKKTSEEREAVLKHDEAIASYITSKFVSARMSRIETSHLRANLLCASVAFKKLLDNDIRFEQLMFPDVQNNRFLREFEKLVRHFIANDHLQDSH